jgi:hypothetical protein
MPRTSPTIGTTKVNPKKIATMPRTIDATLLPRGGGAATT